MAIWDTRADSVTDRVFSIVTKKSWVRIIPIIFDTVICWSYLVTAGLNEKHGGPLNTCGQELSLWTSTSFITLLLDHSQFFNKSKGKMFTEASLILSFIWCFLSNIFPKLLDSLFPIHQMLIHQLWWELTDRCVTQAWHHGWDRVTCPSWLSWLGRTRAHTLLVSSLKT